MLFHLLVPLADQFSAFNVFRYITFRTAAATLTALFISFLVGPAIIRALGRNRVGQPIREIGPDHQAKEGTPTMGGLLILLSLFVSVLLWADLTNRAIWIVLGLTFGYGVLGLADECVARQGSAWLGATPKGFAVASLKEIIPANPNENKPDADNLKNQLRSALTTDAISQYLASLRQRYPVEINRSALDYIAGRNTGS